MTSKYSTCCTIQRRVFCTVVFAPCRRNEEVGGWGGEQGDCWQNDNVAFRGVSLETTSKCGIIAGLHMGLRCLVPGRGKGV